MSIYSRGHCSLDTRTPMSERLRAKQQRGSVRAKQACEPSVRFSLLTALAAKLLVVELLDCLDRWLELVLAGAHHHEDAEVDRVDVRIREQALHDAEKEGTMRCRARQGGACATVRR